MKYFTKYIPVEEEINVGDVILSTDGYQDKINSKNQIQSTDKLLKLFLCSRDVKVGDTFFDGKGYEYVYQEEDFSEEYFENGLGYKPIGIISPEALSFTKEGNEFNEDEIEFVYQINHSPWKKSNWLESGKKGYYDYIKAGGSLPMRILVKIKGTCGHFH